MSDVDIDLLTVFDELRDKFGINRLGTQGVKELRKALEALVSKLDAAETDLTAARQRIAELEKDAGRNKEANEILDDLVQLESEHWALTGGGVNE